MVRRLTPTANERQPGWGGAYGRMGVWAYGRMGVWTYGRMGVWAYGRIGEPGGGRAKLRLSRGFTPGLA
jgi:hypothetical protein